MNLGIIIQREYVEHVAKKSFIFTTLLMPVLMLALMAAPTLIAIYSSPSARSLAVIDRSGIIIDPLQQAVADKDYITLTAVNDSLPQAMANKDFDGVLVIGSDIVDNPSNAMLYTHDASSIELEQMISSVMENTIEDLRLKNYNIDNLQQILDEVKVNVNLQTSRITDVESGSTEGMSSIISYVLGLVMALMLYMFLLLYGQMVMTSIIEEKNNRVLEIIVSSVKPMQLMLGKIIGVGLMALTQIVIWGVLLCLMSAFLLPLLMPEQISTELSLLASGQLDAATATTDIDLLRLFEMMGSVAYIAKLFGYIVLFLIGGFLFYASIFAAIGSAVDNIQDASQLQTFAMIPIMVALFVSLAVVVDPGSQLAVWTSIIPFTSPMVMLARIPFGIASWQIWLSVVLLYASMVALTWVAAKIYRVGIFMYGKKPNLRDLMRWISYK